MEPSSLKEKLIALSLVLLLNSTTLSLAIQSFSVAIPSNGSIYYQPTPQILFEDEFESGDFAAWNGTYVASGNASVESLNPYEGVYHGLFETDALASGVSYAYSYVDLSPVSEVHARAYVYINNGLSLDDSNDRFGLIAFEVGGHLQATFRVYRSGGVDRFNIIGLNGTGTVQKSTGDVFPVMGRWYCIEFYIKVHGTKGEYRGWINGVERIIITNVNTSRYGSGVSRVRFGLTSTINVQHSVEVYFDCVVVSTRYIGQLRYTFGVIGSVEDVPAIKNFYWLFGNQSISYRAVLPSEVERLEDIERFEGIVVWTNGHYNYNITAIRLFAKTYVVISDIKDFCEAIYPSLGDDVQVVSTSTVTYVRDWGNFRNGDLVEMRNETGNLDQLTAVSASSLALFDNVTVVTRYDNDRVTSFYMNGTALKSGFFVMDLDATTPETEWAGIWHVFPAVKMVSDFPTGKYARWMANGQNWWGLDWVYNRIDTLVSENGDVAKKLIIGYSVEGREIPAIFIGNGSRYAIIDGCIHGNEKTATFAALRTAELLIEYYRSNSYWKARLSEYTVIIIPVLNPDGFFHYGRCNANGVDLNSQFPPDHTPTEPEAWALIWLMGNYTPTAYVNMHEGWYWYPLDMIYGNYESGTNKSLTIAAMHAANNTFVELKHWGWFTENDANVWIGKVRRILRGGKKGMAVAYASYYYNASCMLLETFLWTPECKARKCLWGLDYYPAVVLSFLKNIQR